MNRIKEAYTAQELAPLLGKTERGIRFIGKRDNWDRRLCSGRGGRFEYPTIKLPADVRETIALAVSAEERESLPVVLEPATPAVVESPTVSLSHLTARERDVALARKTLIDAVCNFETVGKSRRAAILLLVEAYRNGTLPRNLMEAARIANPGEAMQEVFPAPDCLTGTRRMKTGAFSGWSPPIRRRTQAFRSGSRYSG